MNEEADPIIGTAEAAELLGWSQRKVQRVIKAGLKTGEIPIVVSQVGHRGEYVFRKSDAIQLADEN